MAKKKMTPALLKLWQDHQLRLSFELFNKNFFDNNISSNTIVRFGKAYDPKEKNPGDAHYLTETREIVIDELYRTRSRTTQVLLLHEMAHANLYQNGFIGWPEHRGHSTTFHGEITRLLKVGAYDELL